MLCHQMEGYARHTPITYCEDHEFSAILGVFVILVVEDLCAMFTPPRHHKRVDRK